VEIVEAFGVRPLEINGLAHLRECL
jgi:hypothetical protein